MEISKLSHKNLSFPSLSAFSSNWSPSVSKFMGFPGCNGRYNGHRSQILNLYLFESSIHGCVRGYKTSSFDAYKEMGTGRIRPKAMQKQAANIIDLIKRDEYDLESKLDSLRPELRCNSDICSLVIDNCGRLDDYDDMRSLLNEFNENRLCLTKKAFEFLHGVSSLMEMFSALGFFDMVKFVMKKTERKISHYYILIREMCRRCDFKGVRDIQDEMREEGFELSSRIYNYLISCLLKNGEYADACKIEIACHYFDEMVARDLEPRLSTHAAFIKGFFYSEQYEEAYKYVVDSDKKYKCSSCMNYSLLARLHQKRGNLVIAQNILSEMIKKGLRPYFKVYMKVLNCLDKSGRETLATDLQEQFHQLHSKA
ncbi:hypothetical protein OIU85_003274 [Salix viminalis]|uniref:Pentacotripeptide-repeat region of PRORP domain-containing protein n=1 Tax=Salix viminalis TaxID=40686 RepID=A0A9Q0PYT5_SALVM|nr:hypothetical protein OIU85_003274 [Salix viminalis]